MQFSFRILQQGVHPIYARMLTAELQARGFGPEDIMYGSGLSWDTLHHSNQFLNFDQMRRLALQGMKLTQCPWLGLEVGLRTQASAHGVLGAAMIASKNLPEALSLLRQYAALRQNLANLHLQFLPEPCAIIEEWVPLNEVREYLHGQLLGGLVRLIGTLTGRELPPLLSVEWPFPESPWSGEYKRLAFDNSFGHKQLKVKFHASLLDSPSLGTDEESLTRLVRECDLQLKRLQEGASLAHRVRLWLQSHEAQLPHLPEAAARENLTERTFMRRLSAEHTSYQDLLDEVRMERASWLLQHTDTPVEQVAYAVGYEDASNFSRTFKRWTGLTPKSFRGDLH